ncbi:MAG: type I-C CRISPR-associated protein Cas8c/Csd1 [Nitrospirota bacterium]
MILQALYDYYQRKSDLPRPGFELKEIPFIIELDRDGTVTQIEDTRTLEDKRKRSKAFLVPQGVKKSVNVAANLLWGNAEYVLGTPDSKKLEKSKEKGKEADYRRRLDDMHDAFVALLKSLPDAASTDDGIRAVTKFCENRSRQNLDRFGETWEEITTTNPNLSFRLQSDVDLVCQRPAIVRAISNLTDLSSSGGVCLVTGALDRITRLHPPIKGVWGAQTSGANIVSANLDAFNSYGKQQGANSPVGGLATFAYTTALNYLLARDSKQRIQVGDATTVFWANRPTALEDRFLDIFEEPPKDDPDRNVRALKALYDTPQQGVAPARDAVTRFFVLGLAPNAARIAIRFWQVGTVEDMAGHIKNHFDDLKIVHSPFEKPALSLFRLLVSTAVQGEAKSIPPTLGGEVMRSILGGLPYPGSLLQAVIRRARAEQGKKDKRTGKRAENITYATAAVIKACLNRQIRSTTTSEKELTVSLDPSNRNSGYRLGRLFAVLEKVQEEASPGINATIRDRFYGAASSTPVAVFANLMKLKNHHLAKLENQGRRVNLERLIGEIMDGVNDFPSHLSLADQGRFAIGYYHQRQSFFSKSEHSRGD